MWKDSGNARTLQWMELVCNPRLYSTSSVSLMVKGATEIFRGMYSGDNIFWRAPNVALPESELHSEKAGAQERAYRELELVLGARQHIGKGTEKQGS